MDNLYNNFHFLRPEYLILLIVLPLITLFKYGYNKISGIINNSLGAGWASICNQDILDFFYSTKLNKPSKSKKVIFPFLYILIVLSLCGPTYLKKEVELFQNNNSWILALSLSDSMNNNDITPTRLERAKYKIKDFLNYIHDEQLGFIVYTNQAFEIIPLTTDKRTVDHLLPSIEPLIMPSRGNDVNSALVKAQDLIKNLNLKSSNILLFTDSSANSDSLLTAQKLMADNITINIVNLNPTNNNNTSLRELSTLSKGVYQDLTNNDVDIRSIMNNANQRYNVIYEQEKQIKHTILWQDLGPWLLLLIMPLVVYYLFSTRTNMSCNLVISLAFISLLLSPFDSLIASTSENNMINSILYNKQQRAADQLLNNQDVAPDIFTHKKWQALAEYKIKNYAATERLLQSEKDEISRYNYANSLAKQGKLQQAIQTYNEILKNNPEHTDAQFNKELLEKFLQSQQNKQSQDNQNDQNENNDKDQQSSSSSQNNQQNKDNQQNSQDKQQNNQASKNNNQQHDQKDSTNNSDDNEQQKQQETAKQNEQQQEQNKDDLQQATAKQSKTDKELEAQLDKIPDNPSNYLRKQLQYDYWKKIQRNN